MKTLLKVLGITVGSVVLLFVIGLLVLQTGFAKNIIKTRLADTLSNTVQGTVTIDRLSGFLPWNPSFEGITLTREQSQVARIHRIKGTWSVQALAAKTLLFSNIVVEKPEFDIRRQPDGRWDVSSIIKPQQKKTPEIQKPSGKGIRLAVTSAEIRDGMVRVHPPQQENGPPIQAALALKGGLKDDKVVLDSLTIETPLSRIAFHGGFGPLGPKQELDLTCMVDSLSLSEVGNGLGISLPDEVIQAKITATGPVHKQNITFTLSSDTGQKLDGKAGLDLTRPTNLILAGTFEKIDFQPWVKSLPGVLSGEINARISGTDPLTMQGVAEIKLSSSSFMDQELKDALVTLKIEPGLRARLAGRLNSTMGNIKMDANGTFAGLVDTSKRASGSLKVTAKNADISQLNLSPSPVFLSALDLNASFHKAADAPISEASISTKLTTGRIKAWDLTVDKCLLEADYHDSAFSIQQAALESNAGRVSVKGKGRLGGQVDVNVDLDITNLESLVSPLTGESFSGSAKGSFHVSGDMSNPVVRGNFSGHDLSGMGLTVSEVAMILTGKPTSISTEATLHATNLEYDGRSIPELKLDGTFSPETSRVSFNADIEPETEVEVSATIENLYGSSKPKNITVEKFRAGRKGSVFATLKPIKAVFEPGRMQIQSLSLAQDGQTIDLEGVLSNLDSNDLAFSITDLDLASNLKLLGIDDGPDGILNLNVQLKGTAQAPLIKAEIDVRKILWRGQMLSHVVLDMDYAEQTARLNGMIQVSEGNQLALEGQMPINLARHVEGPRIPDKGMDITVKGDQIDLAFLTTLLPQITAMQARLDTDINARGNPMKPSINGKLALTGDTITVKGLAYNLEDVRLSASFDDREVRLENMNLAMGEKGTMSLNGTLRHEQFAPKDFSFLVKTNDLPLPVAVKDMEPVIDADLTLGGTVEKIALGGTLNLAEPRLGLAWATKEPLSIEAEPRAKNIDIKSLFLASGEQLIQAAGTVSLEGSNNLNLSIKNALIRDNLKIMGMKDAPDGVLNLNVKLTGTTREPVVQAGVDASDILWKEQKLTKVTLDLAYADQLTQLNGLVQAPDGNELVIEGKLPINLAIEVEGPRIPDKGMDISVKGDQIDLAFLTTLVPQITAMQARLDTDINARGNPMKPSINGKLALTGDTITVKGLAHNLEDVRLSASFDDREVRLENINLSMGEKGTMSLNGTLRHEQFAPKDFSFLVKTNDLPLPVAVKDMEPVIDADLTLGGTVEKIALGGTLNLAEPRLGLAWATKEPLSIEAEPRAKNIDIKSLFLASGEQLIQAAGTVSLEGSNNLTLSIKNAAIGDNLKIMGMKDAPDGILNLNARLTGTTRKPVIQAGVDASDILWKEQKLSKVTLDLAYADRLTQLNGLVRASDGNELVIEGKLPINLAIEAEGPRIPDKGMDITVKGDQIDLAFLTTLVPQITAMQARLNTDINARGNPMKPSINGKLALTGDTITVKGLAHNLENVRLSASFDDREVRLENINLSMGEKGTMSLNGTLRHEQFAPKDFSFIVKTNDLPLPVAVKDMEPVVGADLTLGGTMEKIALEGTLNLAEPALGLAWATKEPLSIEAEPRAKNVDIKSLLLASGEQLIQAAGTVSLEGSNNLNLSIKNVAIGDNLKIMGMKDAPDGILNLNARLTGTTRKPVIQAGVNASDILWKEQKLSKVTLDLAYADQLTQLNGLVQAPDGNELVIEGKLPINLAIEAEGPRIPDKGMDISVKGDQIDLAFLTTLVPQITVMQARLDTDITVSGNPMKPNIVGDINLVGEKVAITGYDHDFHEIHADISLTQNDIRIKQFNLGVGKTGKIALNGIAQLDNFVPKSTDLKIEAADVPVPIAKGKQGLCSVDLNAAGTMESIDIKGTLGFTEPLSKQAWKTSEPVWINVAPAGFTFHSFSLSQGKQTISIKGFFSLKGENDSSLELTSLDIGKISELAGIDALPKGIFDGHFVINGTISEPEFTVKTKMSDVEWKTITGMQFVFNTEYAQRTAQIDGTFQTSSGKLVTAGVVPLNLALKKVDDRFGADGLNVTIQGTRFDLSFLPAIVSRLKEVQAEMDINASIKGNLNKPDLQGNINVRGEKIHVKDLEEPLRDVNLSATLAADKITLSTMKALLGKKRYN